MTDEQEPFDRIMRAYKACYDLMSVSEEKGYEQAVTIFELEVELIDACFAAAVVEPSDDVLETIGRVWFERLRNACSTADQTEVGAKLGAFAARVRDGEEPDLAQLPEIRGTLIELVGEQRQRQQERSTEAMVTGIKRAIETTAGMALRVTEEVNGTVVSDSTVLGPEVGHEDTMGFEHKTEAAKRYYGLTDDQSLAHFERVERREVMTMTSRLSGVSEQSSFAEVVTALKLAASTVCLRDLDAAEHVPSIGETTGRWKAGQLPAMRSMIVAQMVSSIDEGAVASRARRGDRSAQEIVMHTAAVLSFLIRSTLCYLPIDAINRGAESDGPGIGLPKDSAVFVMHDAPYPLGTSSGAMAWLLFTDENSQVEPVGVAWELVEHSAEPNEFVMTSLSFISGDVAGRSGPIRRTVGGRRWVMAKPLKLRGREGSRELKREIARSQRRILVDGALGRVHHISDKD